MVSQNLFLFSKTGTRAADLTNVGNEEYREYLNVEDKEGKERIIAEAKKRLYLGEASLHEGLDRLRRNKNKEEKGHIVTADEINERAQKIRERYEKRVLAEQHYLDTVKKTKNLKLNFFQPFFFSFLQGEEPQGEECVACFCQESRGTTEKRKAESDGCKGELSLQHESEGKEGTKLDQEDHCL